MVSSFIITVIMIMIMIIWEMNSQHKYKTYCMPGTVQIVFNILTHFILARTL